MVIDAMDLLYTDRPEAFGIVSSDSDFTPLVMHLKAKGAQVYGFGAKKTPMPFVNACSRFLYLENLGRTTTEADAEIKPETRGRRTPARKSRGGARPAEASRRSVGASPRAPRCGSTAVPCARMRASSACCATRSRSAVGEDGWSALGSVGQQIGNQASFDPRNYGYQADRPDRASQLFELDRRGSQVVLRDKRQGSPRAADFAGPAKNKAAREGRLVLGRAGAPTRQGSTPTSGPQLRRPGSSSCSSGRPWPAPCARPWSSSSWSSSRPFPASGPRLLRPVRAGRTSHRPSVCVLRSSRVRPVDEGRTVAGRTSRREPWPAGVSVPAFSAAFVSALTSARLTGAEACANAPCANTAKAAEATTVRTVWVFIETPVESRGGDEVNALESHRRGRD